MKKNIIATFGMALALFVSSCEMEPVLADAESVEIPNVTSMRQMIDGAYVTMSNYSYMGRNMILTGELRADNVYANNASGRFTRWSSMNLLAEDADATDLMRYAYGSVTNPNIILATNFDGIVGEDADKNQIVGEAYLMRAYAHFDLVRVFGQRYSAGNDLGVSYVKVFKGPNLPRATVSENLTDIKDDIANAISHLQQGATSSWANSKTNFNLDAAYALQSRVGTYFKDYSYAYSGSNMIVDKYPVTPKDDVVESWEQQTPPPASIMEIFQNTSTNNSGINSIGNIYRGSSYGDVQVLDNLIADAGFESGDVRASAEMINTDAAGRLRNVGKYPSIAPVLGQDNIKVFRVEEIVLNHAEALANGAGSGDALSFLNRIPSNRGASNYGSATMDNILKERRKELLFEGFRFYDFARTGRNIPDPDAPTNNHGEVTAGSFLFAFPIPQREIDSNSNSQQNPNY